MRLAIVEHGHTFTQKLFFRIVGLQMGHVPGPIRVPTYRRGWFGARFVDCITQGLRQTREWNKSEAELFAAFVSKKNRCAY